MSRDECPPFARGQTFYNGTTKDPVFSDPLNYLGKEYVFEPNAQMAVQQSAAFDSSGRAVRVRVVMNKSGVNLKPSRIARYKVLDPFETQVDGYTSALADRPAGVIDEFLPPAGVPDGDLFYLVVDGPTTITQLSASAATLAIGDRLVPGVGTSATNDDAGRVNKQDLTGATATLGNNLQNAFAVAGAADAATLNALVKAVVHLRSK